MFWILVMVTCYNTVCTTITDAPFYGKEVCQDRADWVTLEKAKQGIRLRPHCISSEDAFKQKL